MTLLGKSSTMAKKLFDQMRDAIRLHLLDCKPRGFHRRKSPLHINIFTCSPSLKPLRDSPHFAPNYLD
jgi:hypothetical protein